MKNLLFNLGFIYVGIFLIFLSDHCSSQINYQKEDSLSYKWELSDIYIDWANWNNDYQKTNKLIQQFAHCEGSLAKDSDSLLKALKLMEEINVTAFKVYFYPYLKLSLDNKDADARNHIQDVYTLFSKWDTETFWFKPEFLSIPKPTIDTWISTNEGLGTFSYYLEKMYNTSNSVLPKESEKVLSYFSRFSNTPQFLYSLIISEKLDYPEIELSNKQKIKLTPEKYYEILQSDSLLQTDRANAYNTYQAANTKLQNVYGGLYATVCIRDWAAAQASGYSSSLESVLSSDNLSIDLYENLIKMVKNNTTHLHKYMKLKSNFIKRKYGLTEVYTYDTKLEISKSNKIVPFDTAKKWITDAALIMGQEYTSQLQNSFDKGWIDVYPQLDKSDNPFCINVYDVHPFILLNYNNNLSSSFTLAHELGHLLNSYYSYKNQPFFYAQSVLFLAEIASLFNERLLLEYLLQKTNDPKDRIYIISSVIEELINDLYYPTMLAEFEYEIHKTIERNGNVSAKFLSQKMLELDSIYYGAEIKSVKDYQGLNWMSQNHFYEQPFYVFKYATSYIAAAKIYEDIIHSETDSDRQFAIERYKSFLKSGSSNYPTQLLEIAGIDFNDPQIYNAIFTQFSWLVNQYEQEINELN